MTHQYIEQETAFREIHKWSQNKNHNNESIINNVDLNYLAKW